MAAIILAAGSASRMGRLKQLLSYRGKPLVSYAVESARNAQLAPMVVVVGAEADKVRAALASYPVEMVSNPSWASGMGSSVAAGIRYLQDAGSDCGGVAILLADQPLIAGEHLARMRRLLLQGDSPIVAAQYNGTLGVPAFFKREMFAVLAALEPGAGARALLRNSGKRVCPYSLPEAAFDVDTPDDFAALPT